MLLAGLPRETNYRQGTYTSSHILAYPWCLEHSFPTETIVSAALPFCFALIPRICETYQHLLVLAHSDALSLNNLNIFQATENIVLHLERGLDAESAAFLDGERLILETVDRSRL